MSLEQWDRTVGHHLHMIEAGAEMAARHADRLLARPDFETLAQDELARAEKILESALRKLREAGASYGSKEVGS
jgi:hypothetical protein